MMARLSTAALGALLLVSAGGCGLFGKSRAPEAAPATPAAPAAEAPTGPSTVLFTGMPDMNAGGNAARVYLYPLASDATFLTTPVQVFWDDPAEALGADLVGTARDVTVRPGDATFLRDIALGEAAFVGIAVDLREPDGSAWRAALPAASVRGRTLSVTVTATGLQVGAP